MSVFLTVCILIFTYSASSGQQRGYGHNNVGLSIEEIVESYGYPLETHTVITDDGYIIDVHRVPSSSKNKTESTVERVPVLIHHGIVLNSASWFIIGKEYSLPIMLSDNGYDVWLMNIRGSIFSRHSKYDRSQNEQLFYNFSLNEVIDYDIPNVIDYILKETNYEKLFYIGFSQGTFTFLSLLASKPEYNNKIFGAALLAPIWYGEQLQAPLFRFLRTNNKLVMDTLLNTRLNRIELLPDLIKPTVQRACVNNNYLQQSIYDAICLFTGRDPTNFIMDWINIIVLHFPQATSLNNYLHVNQILMKGEFGPFNYNSPELNQKFYGTIEPPKYDLSKVSAKIGLFVGRNDLLTRPKDLAKLKRAVKSITESNLLPDKSFSHLSFVTSLNAKDILYPRIVQFLNRHKNYGFNSVYDEDPEQSI